MSPSKSGILTHSLNQTAVYWPNPAPDGWGGKSFDEAEELDPAEDNGVRWVQRQELFIDAQGQEQRSNAVVHVAQDVDLGGYLYLGTLDDLSSAEEADPLDVSGAYEIRNFEKYPDRRGTRFVRKVWL